MVRGVMVAIAAALVLGACSASGQVGASDTVPTSSTTLPPVTSLAPVPTTEPTTTTTEPTTTTTFPTSPPLVTEPSRGGVVDRYTMDLVGVTEPGVAVTVDGRAVDVSGDGTFAVPVVNDLGPNTVVLRLDGGAGVTATHVVRYDFDPPAGWVAAIGDSVMLGSAKEIEKRLGEEGIVDAVVSRQFAAAPGLVEELVARPDPPQVIIVGLGTNGPAAAADFDRVMEIAGEDRTVVFVNVRVPRSWEATTNRVLAEGVERYDNAVLVDWYAATKDRDDLFAAGGFHPKQAGRVLMGELIAGAIFPNWTPLEEG